MTGSWAAVDPEAAETRMVDSAMVLSLNLPASATVERGVDQRVLHHDVRWADYEALLAMRGEWSVPRITYLEGELELLRPSRQHEILKKTIARLVEAYSEELGLGLEGYGSWTLRKEDEERGAEPDECYSIGVAGEVPDLAIEVIWTSGGLDKLEVYRRLGVREVWIWREGRILPFALRGDRYEPLAASELLPRIDLGLVASLLEAPSQTEAVRRLRARRARPADPDEGQPQSSYLIGLSGHLHSNLTGCSPFGEDFAAWLPSHCRHDNHCDEPR